MGQNESKMRIFYSALIIIVLVIPQLSRAQHFNTDTVFTQEERLHIYETNKIVIKLGNHLFESSEDYRRWINKKIMGFRKLGLEFRESISFETYYWEAYQADTLLTEEEFFDATGCTAFVDDIRARRSSVAVMKWSSPLLIIGGVLLSGFSSGWGQNQESDNVLPVIGVGVSVVGLIFGAEAISKTQGNMFPMHNAFMALDLHNILLKKRLGLIDSVARTNNIKTAIDSLGITVVPFSDLDSESQPSRMPELQGLPRNGDWLTEPVQIIVEILIDTSGYVLASDILESSGVPELDHLVLENTWGMSFHPPTVNGEPVYTTVVIPLKFSKE
jgi:TonB family protein